MTTQKKNTLAEYKRIRKESPDYPAKWALHYAKQWAEILRLEADPEIEIEIIADQDDLLVRGNAIASGDDAVDKKCEDEILRRLDNGDVWAWASVEVKVTKAGRTESDYLGGCSYRDEKDFKRGGYYYDMVTRCLETIESELDNQQDAACDGVGHKNQKQEKRDMKTVFKSNEIAHVWANEGATEGHCPSSMSFNGDAFYSYGTVIARRIRHKGKTAYVVDHASFSVTTSQHQNAVRSALKDTDKVFSVHCGARGQYLDFTPATLRDFYLSEFRLVRPPSKYQHKRADQFLARVCNLEKAIEVCDHFGLASSKLKQKLGALRGDVIEQTRISEAYANKLRIRRNERAVKERFRRESNAIRQAESVIRGEMEIEYFYGENYLESRPDLLAQIQALRFAKDKAEIESWQRGERQFAKHEWPAMLRAEMAEGSSELVTSKGARVPMADAERTFRFAVKVRSRGWHRNGDQHKIGMYQLDAVNEFGVVAGCHRIAWDEIERFAKEQNWI